MSSIFDYPLKVFTAKLRNRFHQLPSSSSSSSAAAQDETQDERPHYQHGIPGIPTDGKVVLLKNSNNGSQIYLVGTCHISKASAELVKKVIDYVRPDVVAVSNTPYSVIDHDSLKNLNVYMQVELCMRRAEWLMNLKPAVPEDYRLYKLFCNSMRAPGGLCKKIEIFFTNCSRRRLNAKGIFRGLEFKVAIEESFRVGARCFYIDQDIDVTRQQLFKETSSFDLLRIAYRKYRSSIHPYSVYQRSYVQEMNSNEKKRSPDMTKVVLEDRDKIMFTNLRNFQGKVVAVVGMGHMDGIELLWKRAEEDDLSNVLQFEVQVELCKGRAERFMDWKPKEVTLFKLFCKSMRAPGGLCMKIYMFYQNYWYHRLLADGIFPGLEFKVAMEESSRVGARCVCIDQDNDVTDQQLSKVLTFAFLWKSKVMVEDRDKIMFTNLRSLQGKVVAVVGMGHMDGIELLWKRAEEVDNSSFCITI
ncbi:hypothetical protein MKW94_004828, partial [Papaver nudicaule]|nr:hypothetical protein [Papaver nudicaule]